MGKLMAIVQPLPKRVPFIGFSQYSHCPKSCHHRFNESIRASSSGRWCECKIAGFLMLAVIKGFDGNQGVILPRANIAQLMLRDDIVQAVKDEQFHIYAIDHITDALALCQACSLMIKISMASISVIHCLAKSSNALKAGYKMIKTTKTTEQLKLNQYATNYKL